MAGKIYDRTNTTFIADLDNVTDASGQTQSPIALGAMPQLNADGTGQAVVHSTHPAADELQLRRVVRFLEGSSIRGVFSIDKLKRVFVDPAEDSAYTVAASGAGLFSRTSDALVLPRADVSQRPTGLTRVFNWATPGTWAGWFDGTLYEQTRDSGGDGSSRPVGFPDPFAQWIWPEPDADAQTAGTCYMRRTFTLDTDALFVQYLSADDRFASYMDGFELDNQGTTEQFNNWRWTWRNPIRLSAGEHVYAVAVNNQFSNGPGGYIGSGWTASEDGGIQDLIILSGTDTSVPEVGTWLTTEVNPTQVPGWSAGDIIITLIEEAQARGALADLTWDFNGSYDSAGVQWPIITEFAFAVPKPLHEVLLALSEAWIDIGMADEGLVLRAWDKTAGRGVDSGVVLAPQVNLLGLSYTEEF